MKSRILRNILRFALWIAPVILLAAVPAAAGSSVPDSAAAPSRSPVWEFSLAGYYYSFPYDKDLLVVVGWAQHGALHLEGRYNYEDRKTGSLFAGWTFSTGEALTASLTPMAGVAFGQTSGFIPALEAELAYGIADLYVETEYLYDFNEKSDGFFYTWLELGFSPGELFRLGLVAERTRLFETPLVVDRGPFVQIAPGFGSASVYAFNLFTEIWYLVIGLQVDW
jgi:hypothetical protein